MSIDLLSLIPDSVKKQALDAIVDVVADQASRHLGDAFADKFALLRSDGKFRQEFNTGLARAIERFIRDYEVIDEDLVSAIAIDSSIFANREVQSALVTALKNPATLQMERSQATIVGAFDSVLPGRKSRDRVNSAVSFLLKCLAEELWHLPELQPIYSLQFQHLTAEATREQVELGKAQLQQLTTLNSTIRDSLLQLVGAMGEKRLLPASSLDRLPAIPEVFHNLPQPDHGKFVGREAECAKLQDVLRAYPHSQYAVVTIDGIGGVGKSALALEIAHSYLRDIQTLPEEDRFKAIVWVSAKQNFLTAEGIKNRPQSFRTLEDIYSAIGITLQRQDIAQIRPDEQHQLVRAVLSRQRTLLIIDNLETVDDESVIAFLHELPAPTKAIVTTRQRIDIAYPIRLVGMSLLDAEQLMAQECETKCVTWTKEQRQRLYDRTGGVPLAMVWSIALASQGHDIEAILIRLGEDSNDVSRFCFEGIAAWLSGRPAYRLLIALSICATDASREALGEMAALPVVDRDQGLVELEKLSLVNKRGSRFSLLPLTKVFARGELRKLPDFERQVWRRWLDYLKRLSKGEGVDFTWYTNEYAVIADGQNILEAIEWSYQYGSSDDVFTLVPGASTYLDAVGNWNEILNVLDRVALLARSSGDQKAIAGFATALSWLYGQRGDYETSRRFAEEGLRIYESLGNLHGEAHSLQMLGASVRKQKQYSRSAELSREALRIAEQLGNQDLVALVKTELGKLARDEGDWERAWQYFQDVTVWAEERVEQSPRDDSLAFGVYGQLAYIAYKTGRYDEAKSLCLTSLDFFSQFGTKGYYATLKHRLALVEYALGNKEAALVHIEEAIYWLNHLGMKPDLEDAIELRDRLNQAG